MNNEMVQSDIVEKIQDLKRERNAVILAHNYQPGEVQDIADYLGDSLELSRIAEKTDADVIIFCGVHFMAETASILSPEKRVLLPDMNAGCPMADMLTTDDLRKLKAEHPDAGVVGYVNTTAEVKALSDICCTSSNGVNVVKSMSSEKVIFVPDQNLGAYIQRFTLDKEMILWPGMCPTHHEIRKDQLLKIKEKHPKAEILVHPECRPEIIDIADHALSTNGMVNHAKKSDAKEFIIGTEKDMCYRLKNENPDKVFYPIKTAICPDMKKITLKKVLNSLRTLEPKVNLDDDVMEKAKMPLQKMMDIGRGD